MSLARYSPLYRWLGETLRTDIERGVYKPGDALPTEHELMRRYGLSITTVRRAVHDLVRAGLIYRQAGRGTFVLRAKLEEHLLRLTSFAEEMMGRGIQPHFKLVAAQLCTPPAKIADALKIASKEQAFYIERVQMAEREPIALARGYWIRPIGEQLLAQDLHQIPLYGTIENIFHISLNEAVETISAQTAPADIARLIKIHTRAPLLVRERLTFTNDMQPIEHTTTYYRADRYEYSIRLVRQVR